MNHFALTEGGNIRFVRWPPRWYYYDPSGFKGSETVLPGIQAIKKTHTELSNWTDEELSHAWVSYTNDMGVPGAPAPKDRDLLFCAYLYAKKELNFSGRKLDDLADLWSERFHGQV